MPTDGDDITNLGDARSEIDRLRSALAARDQWIRAVGHELRNSVAPLVLLAEQVADSPPAPATPPSAQRVAILGRAVHKLVATIDRMSDVSQLQSGRLHLDISFCDIGEVAAEVCAALEPEAKSAGLELRVETTGELHGSWDRARIRQIASSLITNAIRYSGNKGAIEISIRRDGNEVELVVADHGVGIAPANREHLFAAFEHGSALRRGSLGISLWIVKQLCQAMNGSVRLDESHEPGARFCVRLPVA